MHKNILFTHTHTDIIDPICRGFFKNQKIHLMSRELRINEVTAIADNFQWPLGRTQIIVDE